MKPITDLDGHTVRQARKPSTKQREWQGLTDEDIALIDWESLATKKDCARAIEAKLKERNT